MSRDRVIPVLVSVAVIVLVAAVQERSRHLAAVLASMPLTAPLAIWIVHSASGGDARETAGFSGSLIAGSLASLAFVVACWAGLRLGWSLPAAFGAAGAVWLPGVATLSWLR